MYHNIHSKEQQILPNGEAKLSKDKFTKSLTSFHTKKSIPKNISQQNQLKNSGPIKQEKSVKNKKIYFSR